MRFFENRRSPAQHLMGSYRAHVWYTFTYRLHKSSTREKQLLGDGPWGHGRSQVFFFGWGEGDFSKIFKKIEKLNFLFLGKFVTKNRAFGNNTLFQQQFFRFRGGGVPLPLATPLLEGILKVDKWGKMEKWKETVLARRKWKKDPSLEDFAWK